MSDVALFPWAEYSWAYAVFVGFVGAMLLLDLGVFHRKDHVVTFKESAAWSTAWILLALSFCCGLFFYSAHVFSGDPRLTAVPNFDPQAAAQQVALEFLTGFIIEKSLAIDNIFVFVVVFTYFSIPAVYQHRVLFFGILGALAMRAIFIALGSVLLSYHWVILVAGAFLVLTGVKILIAPEKVPDPGANILIRLVRRFVPVTPTLEGRSFFVRKDGRLYATPLFLALVFIEFSDIIFAIDSVPAIFAVTSEPFIVFTSNIFAILGLRSLYFMLATLVDKFRYLKYGLGLILIFVGLKMTWLNSAFGGKFPIPWSLGIIIMILVGSVAASWLIRPQLKLKS